MISPETRKEARRLAAGLTRQQKARLVTGRDYWTSEQLPNSDLKPIVFADGPHGLRRQGEQADYTGLQPSYPAVCYPAACATACSFDPALLKKIGHDLGQECIDQGVDVLLGPGINHKRTPWCGRSFEYYAEDPLVSATMASGFIQGLQEEGIMACLKHAAGNSQENYRMTSNSIIDEATFRQLYLQAFEKTIQWAKPAWIMTSYNQINGVYATENKELMDRLKSFGFDGAFISDWGSVNDPLASFAAGTDLEMPGLSKGSSEIVSAQLDDERLNDLAVRQISAMLAANQIKQRDETTKEDWLTTAQQAAEQSAVLLKNDNYILPLRANESIAVIGYLAAHPRYQGAGSSKVNPYEAKSLLEVLDEENHPYIYAAGTDENGDTTAELLAEAVKAACSAKKAVLVLGLPEIYESEGFDRDHLQLPAGQIQLVKELKKVNPNLIVLLQTGSVVELPFLEDVSGLLLMYLAGSRGSQAALNLLLGKANPSGRLAETWIQAQEQVPVKREDHQIHYKEGMFSGYRYYNALNLPVNFPFGYGLSYSKFSWLEPKFKETADQIIISVQIKNESDRPGSEVIQVYGSPVFEKGIHPAPALQAFKKVWLEPHQAQTVEIQLPKTSLTVYDEASHSFRPACGKYELQLARNSRDIAAAQIFRLNGIPPVSPYAELSDIQELLEVPDEVFAARCKNNAPQGEQERYGLNTTIEDIRNSNRFYDFIFKNIIKRELAKEENPVSRKIMASTIAQMPVRLIGMYGLSKTQVNGVVDLLNHKYIKGFKKLWQSQN